MPPAWWFSVSAYDRRAARPARARRGSTARDRTATNRSTMLGAPPTALHAASRSPSRAKDGLPLAVVAEAARLQDRGEPDARERARELVLRVDARERGGRDARAARRTTSRGSGPARPRALRPGEDRCAELLERAHRRDRDALELVRHDAAPGRERRERGACRRTHRRGARPTCPAGLSGRRIEEQEALPERRRPRAPASVRAGRRRGRRSVTRFSRGSGCARTSLVCSSRNFASAARCDVCFRARIAVARRAALIAPARPMASVPTGMPAGICAMERRESIPLSAFDWIGTPRTGRAVFAAVIPGRCAAPPAPAMMTSRPALLGARGVLEEEIGRAVRAHDPDLERDAELLERVGGVGHRLPVGLRAHDDADEGGHVWPQSIRGFRTGRAAARRATVRRWRSWLSARARSTSWKSRTSVRSGTSAFTPT